MELMVPIENKDSIPLYEQIYRYIKTEIRAGRLRAGSRLPSTRTLADNLHVSRSTTQLAYEQLLSEGYIEALPCRGYFVCQIEELVEVKYHGVPEEKEEKQEERGQCNTTLCQLTVNVRIVRFNVQASTLVPVREEHLLQLCVGNVIVKGHWMPCLSISAKTSRTVCREQ